MYVVNKFMCSSNLICYLFVLEDSFDLIHSSRPIWILQLPQIHKDYLCCNLSCVVLMGHEHVCVVNLGTRWSSKFGFTLRLSAAGKATVALNSRLAVPQICTWTWSLEGNITYNVIMFYVQLNLFGMSTCSSVDIHCTGIAYRYTTVLWASCPYVSLLVSARLILVVFP